MTAPPASSALEVESWLAAVVRKLGYDARTGPGAPRVLPALVLWTGMVVCVLRGFGSQSALWRLLAEEGLWSYPRLPITDDAVRKRLARDGTKPLEELFAQVTALLAARIEPWVDRHLAPFATDIVAIDKITLDKVRRVLPALRERAPGDPGLLAGALVAVFDVRRHLWRRVEYREDPHENEKVAARRLLDGLAYGTLILADLGYFGFQWFDDLTDRGFWWLSRLRNQTSYEIIETLYKKGETQDALIWLGKHRADRAKHAVRLIQFTVGERTYRYITNVLEPEVLSMQDAARLYARRWDIEMAVNTIKSHLGLHLFWAANRVIVQQQIWAVLIIAQILASFRHEIAGRAEVDLFDVSLPLLIEYFPRYAAAGTDPVEVFVQHGRRLGFIRPSSRITATAPVIPLEHYHARSPDLVLERVPRYAKRRCDQKAS